ncbi:MAG: hypothetical protein JNK14_19900 [Chitinophagaceae bacterium]|nr:hypothetical protein [Chitinophagaceae bacterium]
MNCTVVDFAKDRTVFNITGCTKEELDNKLNLFFTSEGYSFLADKNGERKYKKGNKVLRYLLGALVKYHQVAITVKNENDLYSVLLRKDSSGFSGGVIGMQQVKKEFTRLTESFKVYLNN